MFVRNEFQIPDGIGATQTFIPRPAQVVQRHDANFNHRSKSLDEFAGGPDIFLRIVAARDYRYPDVKWNALRGDSTGIAENQFIGNAGELLVLLRVHVLDITKKEVDIG